MFRKAVNGISHFAKDYYSSRLDTEQVSDIKSVINLFGKDKNSQLLAGRFLCFTANHEADFDSRRHLKAQREVDNIVDGHYDHSQKRGFSMRR